MRVLHRTKLRFAIGLPAFVAGVLLVLTSGIFVWSPLNCWHEEIDINSGRLRTTRYLLYVKVADETQQTWVSRAISQPVGPADWHRVNTFSPGTGNSPHYLYHSAISQIRSFEQLDALLPFEPAAKKQVAVAVLQHWHQGTDHHVDPYLGEVSDTVFALVDAGADRVTVADLP
ncbi:MAG: hypothetical protein WDZ31_08900 [Phycisphaeraceae bacterium]